MIGFSSSAISVLQDSELSVTEIDDTCLIHMDIDQSFLPIPQSVKAAIFESFARQNISEAEVDINSSIKKFVWSNYGFQTKTSTGFVYADDSQALFNKLVICCVQEGGTLCLPTGTDGKYIAAAKFLKANFLIIQTESSDNFKLTEMSLTKALNSVKKPWVCICGPTVSPTGMVYSNEEIDILLSTCSEFGANVIIDTSFSGLEYNSTTWNLKNALSRLDSSLSVSLLGCLSLNMLSGAMKLGFLVLDKSLVDAFHKLQGLSKPHRTVKYAAKKMLALKEEKDTDFLDVVSETIYLLQCRSKRLKEVLIFCLHILP